MAIDDEIPDPPSLSGPQSRSEYEAIDEDEEDVEDDYRRSEIENFLQDGAWEDAFGEWADTTSMTEADLELVLEYDLIDEYDFYWEPQTDDVGYIAPTLPAAAEETLGGADSSELEAELDTLGRVVTEVLENDYLLRDDADEQFGFFAEEYTGEAPSDEDEPL